MAPGDMPLVAGFAFAVMSSLPRSVIVALLSVGFVLVAAKVVGAFRAKEAPFWLRTAKPIKTPLEDDDTVALLVASRAPRETHGALAAVSRRLARVVSSPALAKERAGAGWLEGPRKMHRVSVRRLRSGRYRPAKHIDHDDPSPGYLFERDVRRCTLVLCQLIVSRRGADPDPRAALWDTFVELVDLFHGHHLVMRRMAIAPSHGDYLVGYSNFGEPRNGLGAGFSDHLVHHAIVIDYAVRHYTRADVEDKDALSLSWYGKRLCDLGLLCEYYDEKARKWSIDADGWMIRDLLSIWGRHGGPDGPGRPCPVDAPMAIVFAYVAVMTAPNVKEHARVPLPRPADVLQHHDLQEGDGRRGLPHGRPARGPVPAAGLRRQHDGQHDEAHGQLQGERADAVLRRVPRLQLHGRQARRQAHLRPQGDDALLARGRRRGPGALG